jgi:aminoglycoside phosphotransferase family enzyme
MPAASPSFPQVSLESRVAFLRQPSSYPETAFRVEAIETHMSWVFLTDRHAYKLKKPVWHEFLDFRTVEARHFFCNEELRLNRRLAPDVYLGVVPLSIDARGNLQLGEGGIILDWLVKMRRLRAHDMLDYALTHGPVEPADIRRVASRLAAFYRDCAPVAMDPADYKASFLRNIDRNLVELSRPWYGLSLERLPGLCQAQRDVLIERPALFDERVSAARIVEGHGDLRPEHVCLFPDVEIIDCLEFARDLRVIDPVDEIGFLALECERLGAADACALLLRDYSELSGDWPSLSLVHFYQGYRASLRAKIAIRHLDEEKFRHSSQWRDRADEYLQLALRHQEAVNSVIDPPS